MGESEPVLGVLKEILHEVSRLRQETSSTSNTLASHVAQEEGFQKSFADRFDAAFPGGDPVLHRLEHEARIERARFCKEFWRARAQQLGAGGVVAFLAVAAAIIGFWWNGHVPESLHVPFGK